MLKKNNKSGFTLVELLVSIGATSLIALAISGALKQSSNAKNSLYRTTEVNSLIQLVTSQLGRKEICETNFKNLIPTSSPKNLTSLKYKTGADIISVGVRPEADKNYADYSVESYESITYSGSMSTGADANLFKMDVVVSFKVRAAGLKQASTEQFSIPVNVYLNLAGAIETCFSDVQSSLEVAVKLACTGTGAKWYAKDLEYPYGRCEHIAEIVDSLNNVVIACPPGELLKLIETSANKMTFQCAKLTTTSTCPAWNYMRGVNSDGSANCLDVRTVFPNAGFAVIRTGVYTVQNISCPNDRILQQIAADGTPICINPRLNYNCPVGQYVQSINSVTGDPVCGFASNMNVCSGVNFMTAIDSTGSVTCGAPRTIGTCGPQEVITGITASGNVICAYNQP